MTAKLVKGRIRNAVRVRVAVPETPILTSYRQRVLCIGSCFASTINRNLRECGFDASCDAASSCHFSTKSVLEKLSRLGTPGCQGGAGDIVEVPGQGFASMKHVGLQSESLEALREEMAFSDEQFWRNLREADIVVYTIGTSTYLKAAGSGELLYGAIAGLEKEIVTGTLQEASADLHSLLGLLIRFCKPSCRFVVTLSPQRYAWNDIAHGDEEGGITDQWQDGLVANAYDKAKLRVALQEALREMDPARFFYFPSYEIVLEELRGVEPFNHDHLDYRHIDEATKNFVANRFLATFTSAAIREFLNDFNAFRGLFKTSTRLSLPALTEVFDAFARRLIEYELNLGCGAFVRRELTAAQAGMVGAFTRAYGQSILPGIVEGFRPPAAAAAQEGRTVGGPFLQVLDRISRGERVAIWGAGALISDLLRDSTLLADQQLAFFDERFQALPRYYGFPVNSPAQLVPAEFDWFLVGSIPHAQEIRARLEAKGASGERILTP